MKAPVFSKTARGTGQRKRSGPSKWWLTLLLTTSILPAVLNGCASAPKPRQPISVAAATKPSTVAKPEALAKPPSESDSGSAEIIHGTGNFIKGHSPSLPHNAPAD